MRLSEHHKTLTDGVGKCSVPMWCNGLPAGFCDRLAYGKVEQGQARYGDFVPARGRWLPHYVPALACYSHGGPIGCCATASPLAEQQPTICASCLALRWLSHTGVEIRQAHPVNAPASAERSEDAS